eukprot:TRINITY_DN243_c0_g1_i1.p1 TRINITY_DN243_c0_g1~~TRINITY_DN243_c0_g1_i1.p1  ORF type:complete len:151 (+),score=39.12 TRINITY_DN243_c0_g1_i1:103-555(+)
MVVIINLDESYSLVIGSAIATAITLQTLAFRVGKARARLGVQLPSMYADQSVAKVNKDAHVFNCIQRGHQNALETYPQVLFLILAGGLKHPWVAAGAGVAWCVGRLAYANGYATGDPEKRQTPLGVLTYVGLLSALGATVSLALSVGKVL